MTPEQLLEECKEIQKLKRNDYVSTGIHENFERCETIIRWFIWDIDKVYVTLIAVKLTRLAVLLSTKRKPNNESIEDSFKDLINYCALWGSKRCQKNESLNYITENPNTRDIANLENKL